MINKMIAEYSRICLKAGLDIFRKYIAGETIEDAIRVSKNLNSQGIKVTIDVLGEFITDLKQQKKTVKPTSTLLIVSNQRRSTEIIH